MWTHRLEREQVIPRPLDEVFDFYAAARNLERITPGWLGFHVATPEPIRMQQGTLIEYKLRLHGIPVRWLTRIELWEQNHAFVDRQLRGPYKLWHHLHEFEPVDGGTLVRDRVDYALPLGPLGEAAHLAFVERDLRRIFDFRRSAAAAILGSA